MNNKSLANKTYRTKLRQYAIAKLGGKCVKCGTTHNLEFHHRNPTTKIANIAYIIRTHPALLEAELAKCELRCHKHHVQWHKSTIGHYYYVKPNKAAVDAVHAILG